MKNALIFVDGDIIKIVVGSIVKCVNVSEVRQSQNIAFFKQLFANCRVIVLQTAAEIQYEDFKASFLNQQEEQEQEPEEQEAPKIKKKPQPKLEVEEEEEEEQEEEQDIWIKSTSDTTIIVDDLPTNQMISRPGIGTIRGCLSIPPMTAVNLSRLNMEEVRKSSILKKLLQNGTLVRSNAKEAAILQEEYEGNLSKTQFSALDEPEEEEDETPKKKKKQMSAEKLAKSMFAEDTDDTVEVSVNDSDETEEERLARTLLPQQDAQAEVAPKAKFNASSAAGSSKMSMEAILREGAMAEAEGVIARPQKRKFTGRLRG